jgi:hypothetical protein
MPARPMRLLECTDDDPQRALTGLNEAVQARGISESDVISIESHTWDRAGKLQFTVRAFYWA